MTGSYRKLTRKKRKSKTVAATLAVEALKKRRTRLAGHQELYLKNEINKNKL